MKALALVQKRFAFVTNVVDATDSLFLEVSAADSKKADPKNHQSCALARACQQKLHPDGVLISLCSAYVIRGTTATRYRVPGYAAREIVSFDRKAGFAPGIYELKPPPKTDQLGQRDPKRQLGGAHGPSTGNLVKRFHRKTAGVREVLA